MEIHCALGQMGFRKDLVEANGIVGALSQLVSRGAQDLVSRRIRSSLSFNSLIISSVVRSFGFRAGLDLGRARVFHDERHD